MGAGDVHYEVFVRPVLGDAWTLHQAVENRAQAIETAEALLTHRRAVAVRVCKETLNRANGEYASVAILTRGDLRPPSAKPLTVQSDDGLLCLSPSDLYTGHARERIGRLFDAWLARYGVTPFELLHRADLVERLDASGMEIQHALQKISIPEAQARKTSVHEIIRRYRKLADAAVARLLADHQRCAFPDIAAGGFSAAIEAAAAGESPSYLLGGTVAAVLTKAQTWLDKIALLLDLAEAAPQDGPRSALAFRVLEQPLGEILGSKAGMAALMGDATPDTGAGLALMTRLVAPDVVERLIQADPVLGAQFPPARGAADRLALWLARPGFAPVRAALARRILVELNGPRRLHPNDADGEIQAMRAMARVLSLAGPRVANLDEVQDAFIMRSKSLLTADFVQGYLRQAGGGGLGEVLALLRLAENVVGETNKLAAARWLKATVFGLPFERDLMQAGDTAAVKLLQLAELEHALHRVGLGEESRREIAVKLGQIGGLIEAEARLVHAIGHAPAAAPNRLAALLKLANGETAPPGPVSVRARAEALRLMRDPLARSQLVNAPEVVARVQELLASEAAAA